MQNILKICWTNPSITKEKKPIDFEVKYHILK